MKKTFTTEQFFDVFEKYNAKVFPSQLIILLLGIIALYFLHSNHSLRNKVIGCYLGFLWIWIGIVYHIIFFTEINKASFIFGGISIVQGALILVATFSKDRFTFNFEPHAKHYLGYFFILFGLMIYPLIGYFIEGTFIRTITLGLPCPSTIFTFGFLMLTRDRIAKYLLVIPSLWAIVGLSAAVNFSVYQDFMMIVAAIATNAAFLKREHETISTLNLK
jgi:hypothetical protein